MLWGVTRFKSKTAIKGWPRLRCKNEYALSNKKNVATDYKQYYKLNVTN